jgi:hypothetical protein
MTRKRVDLVPWLLSGIFAVLLAIFAYIISLNTTTTRTATRLEALEGQMRDVAGYIGPLWLARNQEKTK